MNNRSLVRELADHDDRQLMDIGLVRGEDGTLRLATDPALPAEESSSTTLSSSNSH